MQVVYITHYCDLYGANNSLLEVITRMRYQYNINPIVITPKTGEINNVLNDLKIENYSLYFFPWMANPNNKIKYIVKFLGYKFLNKISIVYLYLLLRKKNVKLIHTNSSVIDIGSEMGRLLKVPHVWHIREFGKEDYNLDYLVGIRKSIKKIEDYSDRVIYISNSIAQKYNNFISNSEKVSLIYNGVNKEKYFHNIEKKVFDKEFIILFTGLISPKKNQFELVQAINILVNKKKYKDIKVYLIGGGDHSYLNKIKEYITKNNLDLNFEFLGHISNVEDYIKKAHVGVICSNKEAFGRVTVEYMLGGLAVIASDTGANPEIINNKVTGHIYSLGNIEGLAKSLEKLYNDRVYLEKISKNGQKEALKKFTSEINCNNIYAVYQELLYDRL